MTSSPRRLSLLAAGLASLLATASSPPVATAQVVAEPRPLPESGAKDPGSGPSRPEAVLQAGNAIYRVWVVDGAALDCGAWTAATGPNHPATSLPPVGGKNVLYNGEFADPGTSDTTLRSYDTGIYYRTGPNTSRDPLRDCRQLCLVAEDLRFDRITRIGPSGTPVSTGWRGTWLLQDGGSSGPIIEFVQEVNVEGPVDGSETVENTVIRETHVVRNRGPGLFRFGLRKHWDWQIDFDDGPAFGDCEDPEQACDRSLDLTPDGSLDGPYPSTYTINHDPAVMSCPPGVVPLEPGCGGDPLYLVAGTVAPPSSLVPPPDPPDLLQFNNWDVVVDSCWRPRLIDAAPCGAGGNSVGDDTTIAYFYGVDAARALVLSPGQELSFTQYVVAAENGCPSIVEPPTLSCDAGGPYSAECTGPFASVPLDGSGSSESGEPPLFSWSTDCPGGEFDDPAAEDPLLTLESRGCAVECTVTLTVTDSVDPSASTSCSSTVTVEDLRPPELSCPPEALEVACVDGGVRRDDPAVRDWLAQASAFDDCSGEALPVSDDLADFTRLSGCPTERTVTFSATDECGNEASCTQVLRLVDLEPPLVSCPGDRSFECGEPEDDQTAWLDSATAVDGCRGGVPVTAELLGVEEPCAESRIETWRFSAIDSCGNVGSCTATWSVGDTRPPVLSLPEDVVYECGTPGPSQESWLDEASADDACAGAVPVERELFEERRPCPGTLVQTWRFTATDDCGNAVEGFATWTERDGLPPEIAGVPPDEQVPCDAVPPPAEPVVTDLCDPSPGSRFEEREEPGDCPAERVILRRWTAVDACGNEAVATQRLTVVDEEPPVLDGVPADATVECDAVPPPAEPTATDACGPAAVSFSESREDGDCPNELVLTRTWTAIDDCGNETIESRVLTVVDTTPPVLDGVPADATVECDAVPPPASPTATDNCGPAAISFAESREDGACPGEYRLTRTWTATDDCGNEREASQVLTVVDTTPPALTVPPPLILECDGPDGVPLSDPRVQAWLALAGASDACSEPVELGHDAPAVFPFACPDPIEVPVTFVAVDACGNESRLASSVTVVDTTPPVIESVDLPSCLWPPNHRHACFEDLASRVVATDACSEELTVRFTDCGSDQPDEAPEEGDRGGRELGNGDGNTTEDCVVAPDGSAACLRTERQGTDPTGRDYRLVIEVSDACGNAAVLPWTVHVPHDQREHDCEKLDNRLLLKKGQPFPWER